MPFKSQAQRAFLYMKHPKVAKEWAQETPNEATLPEHAGKPKAKVWANMDKKGG